MSKFKPSPGTLTAVDENAVKNKPRRTFLPPAESEQRAETAVVLTETREANSPTELTGPPNSTRRLAFNCTLAFIFLRFSFIHEFISSMLNVDTHLLIILGFLCYGAWLVSGDLFVAFQNRLAWIWVAFVACLVIATATSTWRGGSFAIVFPYIRTTLPLLFLIPAVTSTREDLKRILNTIGAAGSTTTLFGLVHRSYMQGRMEVGTEGSSIGDPNDYAAHMIFLLPAMTYFLFGKDRSIFVKVLGVGIIGSALLEIVSTGSRGGLLTLIVAAAYGLVKSPPKARLALLVGAPLLALLAIPFAPKEATQRLSSLFGSQEATGSAAASTDARRALLMESLKATAQHPLLGVGPGVFIDYQAGMAAEVGQKGMWHETHNGYTQISSESGIPALMLYLWAVILTMKGLKRAVQSPFPDVTAIAQTFRVMVVAFSTSLLFLAQGYRFTMLVVGAIVIAIARVLQAESGRASSAQPAQVV